MNKTKSILIAAGIAITSLVGIDASKYEGVVIAKQDIQVAGEMVKLEQIGDVVSATMPWKGERGLTIKYDMGAPSVDEKLKDERVAQVIAEKVPFMSKEGFKIDILLSEKPNTNTFCYTIEGWEDYDFEYQPPLTQEQLDAGIYQPPEIDGSYAVYHKTLKDYTLGEMNYETGKFGHVPFPYVWEVGNDKNKIRAEDLTYSNGRLCVVVPQSFLDVADYTNGVRIDPTFGYETIGAGSIGIENRLVASWETSTEVGTATNITWYTTDTTAAHPSKGAIYTYDALTDPGSLLALSAEDAGGVGAAWRTGTLSLALASSRYYLGAMADAAAGNSVFHRDSVTDRSVSQTGLTYPTFPDPMVHDGTQVNTRYSIYVTYTAASSDDIEAKLRAGTIKMRAGTIKSRG